MAIVEFLQVTKYHNRSWASLDNISIGIDKGEFVVITGKSGSGKSTILHHIYMKERPTSGRVLVDGYDSSSIREKELSALRKKVGMIFQEPHLLGDRNVFENIALPLRLHGYSETDIRKKVFRTLAYVGLSHRMAEKPINLSTGEKQRVCIARSLISNPLLLLADEPTGNLDSESAEDILKLLKGINTHGTAVIIATHLPAIAGDCSCRRIHMENGKIVNDRRPLE